MFLRLGVGVLGFRLGELIESAKRMARIHRRRAGAHVDRHAQRFQHFLARGAALDGGLGVKGDAIVAALRAALARRLFAGLILAVAAYVGWRAVNG